MAAPELLAENRRARFDYDITETIDAGIELTGIEAKSAKLGRLNLTGAHAIVRNKSVWLVGARIQPFQPKNAPIDYDPSRTRRLLLSAAQIKTLTGTSKEARIALIPLRARAVRNLVKITLGVGRGKRTADKREAIKKRETDRDIQRALRR